MNYVLGLLLLGLLAGWLSGLVGIGGGIIMVPVLMFLFAFSLRTAQGTSIAALAPPIGLLAAYVYYKEGNVDIKAAGLIAAGFFIGGFLGAKSNYFLNKEVIGKIMAVVLITIGIKMFFTKVV
jgi:uncharacterized membrane protein YfcA